jgi:hypothetical protein
MKRISKRARSLRRVVIALSMFAVCCVVAGSFLVRASNDARNHLQRNAVDEALMAAIRAAEVGEPDSLLQAQLSTNTGATGDDFGSSVAISGNTAVVSSLSGGAQGGYIGSVFVFQRNGSTWSFQQKLLPNRPESIANYGCSIAISGDTIAVGDVGYTLQDTGLVHVFQRIGQSWSQQVRLEGGYTFGRSVAISGNTLVVGESAANTAVSSSGAASVYRFNGSTWGLEQQLSASDAGFADAFGVSVGISGETVIVGAFADDISSSVDVGSAYIFKRNGTTWSEQAHLISAESTIGDYCGWSVSISGDTAAVGCYGDSLPNMNGVGSVYVYQRSGTVWNGLPRINASNASASTNFGYSVAIIGDILLVGAHRYDSPQSQNTGAAYIFQRFGSTWTETSFLTLDNGAPGDLFGQSVALSDNTLLVGVPNGDPPASINIGAVNVYTFRPSIRNTGDFDGDGLVDLSVFRPTDNTWYVRQSSNSAAFIRPFGTSGDQLTPGDYDGDGKTDVAVFRPSTGTWYFVNSSNNVLRVRQFGASGDVAAPGDYDGNALTDLAVFRPSTGTWYILLASSNIIRTQQFGASGDRPVQGDYDGDTRTDLAVLRPSNNTWYISHSTDGSVRAQPWGLAGDVAVPGDYDGDTQTDIAVFRPSNSGWYILQSTLNTLRVQPAWGMSGDIAAPGDYNGDGKADIAVFRPANGIWYVLQSRTNTLQAEQWGTSGDVPVLASSQP